jgi:hypothetical protein
VFGVECGAGPGARVAHRAGLVGLADAYLSVPGGAGACAGAKVSAIVAWMIAGADSITDLDLLRHGGTSRLFTGIGRPPRSGFLRAFRFGHVRQFDAVAARFLTALAGRVALVPAAPVTYLDVDDTVRAS